MKSQKMNTKGLLSVIFDSKLPDFYEGDAMSNYFISNINEINETKNTQYFEMDALQNYVDTTEKLENAIFAFVNIEKQKVNYFEDLKKEYLQNNERLRELNDQLVVVKMEKKNFGKEVTKVEFDPKTKELIEETKKSIGVFN